MISVFVLFCGWLAGGVVTALVALGTTPHGGLEQTALSYLSCYAKVSWDEVVKSNLVEGRC